MTRRSIVWLAVFLFLPVAPARPQGVPPPGGGADTVGTVPVRRAPGPDSAGVRTPPGMRLIGASSDTLRHILYPKKSPGMAMLFSAILPGAGQFYNHSYWKVPIVLGFGLYFVSSWLDNNRRYEDYAEKYRLSVVANTYGDPVILNVREFYKSQRDSFTWYFFLLYLINIADAYVDASLYDFNVGGDLSVRVLPPVTGPAVGLRFTF
jgi:hypothetical protein